MTAAPIRRSMLSAIGVGMMLKRRLRPFGKCISLSQLQRLCSANAGDPTRVPDLTPHTVVWALRSSLGVCQDINGMERQSSKRRWTEADDELLRRRALVGWPTLRALAVDLGRTHCAVLTRTSRLGAIRLHRLDPAERERRPTEKRPCNYCGFPFLLMGGARYCGGACLSLSRRQCPGCGRPMGKALRCSHCAAVGKRADWPERATV